MNHIQVFIWLFPILFIFHDFEEIIFMKMWINQNKTFLSNQFPKLSKKLLPHFESATTSSFAFGVAEEFIIISIITVMAYVMNWYSLWIGAFIAFTLHLIIHCIQAIIVRRYIPTIVTSIICLPICIYFIGQILKVSKLSTVIFFSFLCFIIMIINLVFIHTVMDKFGRWLTKYEHNESV